MDEFLYFLGAYRSDVAKDETCVSRAVSEQLCHTQAYHSPISKKLVSFIRKNYWLFESDLDEGEDIDTYLRKTLELWPGLIEMKALSTLYSVRFITFTEVGIPPQEIQETEVPYTTITLAGFSRNRFDIVYSRDDIAVYSICQSIVYELLYKDVFGLGEDVDMAVDKMLHDKNYSKQRKQIQAENLEDPHLMFDVDEEPEKVVKKALAQGIPPFPYKIAKNLDAYIYRNVEFDIWNEERKAEMEEQYTPALAPGVKCWLFNESNDSYYIAHVQELLPFDKARVYVESKIGERCVDISILKPIPIPITQAYNTKYHVGFRKDIPVFEKQRRRKYFKKHYSVEDDSEMDQTPTVQKSSNNESGYATGGTHNSLSRAQRKRADSSPRDCGSYVKNYRPRSYSASCNVKPKTLNFDRNDCYTPSPLATPPEEWRRDHSFQNCSVENVIMRPISNYAESPDETLPNIVYAAYSSPVPNIYPVEYTEQGSCSAVSLPVDIPDSPSYVTEPKYSELPVNSFVPETNVPYLLYPAPLNFESQSAPMAMPPAHPTPSFIINTPPHSGLSPQWVPYHPPSNGVSSWPMPSMPMFSRYPVAPVMNGYTVPVPQTWLSPANFQVVPEINPGFIVPVTQVTFSTPCPGIPAPVPSAQYFASASYQEIRM